MLLNSVLLRAAMLTLFGCLLQAQPVRVPQAQALIDALLKEHPEIQTIGLHVTPPGQTVNVNIACSKPGKVGKVSAEIDRQVIATGETSLRMASKGAFDIGVPIADAAGRKLGMIVVVIPASRARDAKDATRQVLAIRDILQSRIASREALFLGATVVDSPLMMVAQTPLPNVKGGFARLGVEVAGGRLFASAPENHSTEVFDLAGEHLRSEPGDAMPQGVADTAGAEASDARYKCRFRADPSGRILVTEDSTGRVLAELPGAGEPGGVHFDPAGRRLLISGSEGVAVFRQFNAETYSLVCRFGIWGGQTPGGLRSLYAPSKHLFYVLHGKNAEDGAALQVYELQQ